MGALSENPYSPPQAELVAAAAEVQTRKNEAWKRNGKISLALFVSALALLTVGVSFAVGHGDVGARIFFVGSALVASAGFISALRSLVAVRWSIVPVSPAFMVLVAIGGIGSLGMTAMGALMALMSSSNFSRGRQLRRRGKVLLPKIAEKNFSWVTLQIDPEIPEDSRSALAQAWRENGQTEHASVAAFARLTLDLMALGAPPDLIASSNQDALDEIRHAELCFSLACGIDGLEKSPAPFPEAARARALSLFRKLALAELAVDSLIDGALHEGVSARVAAALAKKCESPEIKAVLKEIAADEGRHAAHGWDVVEWCLAAGGASTARALLGAARALPIEMRAPLHAEAEDGSWEKFGIMGRALEADAYPKTRANVMRRVETLVAAHLASSITRHELPKAAQSPDANSSTTQTVPSTSVSAA
ncbi:MAG: ferritin-like domain-containing protein, partial [Polyangiaceae bacterium]